MATNVPEPEQTPDGPAYEGRLLPHPEDEVVDQGASFDVTTLMTRRTLIGIAGLGVGATVLAACTSTTDASSTTSSSESGSSGTTPSESSSSTSSQTATVPEGEIPEETNGPYPADGSQDVDVLEESGIVRSDITTSIGATEAVTGVPLTLTFTLFDMANDDAPFEGAALYVWHCDAQGQYSMYSQGVEDETWLRGVQEADADGVVTFQTVVPGCYAGRWTHVHFEVYPTIDAIADYENVIATSQLAFPADMLAEVYTLDAYSGSTENLAGVGTDISDDGLFDEGDLGLQVPTISGDADTGYVATISVGIDTTTESTMGGGESGPDGEGMPGGPDGDGGTAPDQP